MSMTPVAKPSPLPNGWRFSRRALLALVMTGMAGAVLLRPALGSEPAR